MGYTITHFGTSPVSRQSPDPAGRQALFIMIGLIYIASAVSWLFIDCTKTVDRNP